MTNEGDEHLADLFGPQATHSEHRRGERIHYRLPGEGEYTGQIIWVASASTIDGKHIHQHYIVERDGGGESFPDIVFPADVIQ